MFPHLTKKSDRLRLLCEPCKLDIHTHLVYPSINSRHEEPFDVIFSYVWRPSRITSRKGHRWFIIFIDYNTRITWVYLPRSKTEVFSCFQEFHKMIKTQFDANVKILHSDKGRVH